MTDNTLFLEDLVRLQTAVNSTSLVEVVDACRAVSAHEYVQSHYFLGGHFSAILLSAIKHGCFEILEQVCAVKCFVQAQFDFNEIRDITATLAANDHSEVRRIFLDFLDRCSAEYQKRFVYAAFFKSYDTLIEDICSQPQHMALRCELAAAAVEFGDMDFAFKIVQTTPQALLPLHTCQATTRRGKAWLDLHEKYNIWRAFQELEILTAEVAGVDNVVGSRKM